MFFVPWKIECLSFQTFSIFDENVDFGDLTFKIGHGCGKCKPVKYLFNSVEQIGTNNATKFKFDNLIFAGIYSILFIHWMEWCSLLNEKTF